MVSIEVKITDDYLRKMGINWEDILKEINNKATEKLYEYITTPGDGVKNGNTPSGGAPVDTGNLINSHYIKENDKLENTINTNVEYAIFVINGTSKTPPNNYPERAKENLLNGELEIIINEIMNNLNLK